MRRFGLLVLLAASLVPATASAADYTKITDVRLAMSDGTVLVSDVYVPTATDGDADGLFPCVVELTPYRKESRYTEGASFLPARGIALIEVDARGTGGSQGEYDIVFSVREQRDAVEWIDWAATAASKPDGSKLCEDTVGMYGGSYSGIIQYLTASLPLHAGDAGYGRLPLGSEHLAAIAPQRAYGDLYRDIVYHGGMVIGSFGLIWSAGTTAYFLEPPTDSPSDPARAAWTDHVTKNDPMQVPYWSSQYADATYTSDDTTPKYSQRLYEDSSVLPRIQNLRAPTLHLAGFYDAFTRGQLRTFSEAYALENAHGDRGPNYLIAGPWNHSGTHFIIPDQGFKQLLADWYGYWLEARANGATEPDWGPRVRYFLSTSGKVNAQTPADGEWRSTTDWPPPGFGVEKLYLRHDGTLGVSPEGNQNIRTYPTNPTAGTAEVLSRWDNAAGTPQPQLDQRIETGKGLTWQTEVLGGAVRVAGPIGFSMFASITGAQGDPTRARDWPGLLQEMPPYLDTDFVVKVSDVAPDGSALLVTQGYLRASHRAFDPARSIYASNGTLLAPFHLHTPAALDAPTSGAVRDYQIEIWPTAHTFAKDHRIRLDLYSADTPGHLTIVQPSVVGVYSGLLQDAVLSLPVVS